jgi:hypothetical protein
MKKILLIVFSACILASIPACTGTQKETNDDDRPYRFRISGNPILYTLPGCAINKAFVPFHIKFGYEHNISDKEMAIGAHLSYEYVMYEEFLAKTVSLDCHYYPFVKVTDPGVKPFISLGFNKSESASDSGITADTDYKDFKHPGGLQGGVGFFTGSEFGVFLHVFCRSTIIEADNLANPGTTKEVDVSGLFLEWGLSFRF